MQVGNLSINPEAVKGMTFDEFYQLYAGKLKGVDIKDAYRQLAGTASVNYEDKKEKLIKHIKTTKKTPK
jgi:hypothetical protein